MQTATTVTGWNEAEFERNGQACAYGKDDQGPGTVVTAAHRNKGWMLSGHKDGVRSHSYGRVALTCSMTSPLCRTQDICVRVCWDANPTEV